MAGMGVPVSTTSKRPRKARKEPSEAVSAFAATCIRILEGTVERAPEYAAAVGIPRGAYYNHWYRCLTETLETLQEAQATGWGEIDRRDRVLHEIILLLAQRAVLTAGGRAEALGWGRRWFSMYAELHKGGLEGIVVQDLERDLATFEHDVPGWRGPPLSLYVYLLSRLVGAEPAGPPGATLAEAVVYVTDLLDPETPSDIPPYAEIGETYQYFNASEDINVLPVDPQIQSLLLRLSQAEQKYANAEAARIQAEAATPPKRTAPAKPPPSGAPNAREPGPLKRTRDREIVDDTLSTVREIFQRVWTMLDAIGGSK